MSDIKINKADVKDMAGIVAIHKQAFPDFFLTTLGDRFLRLYYSCMCRSDGAVALCAKEGGAVVGFASSAMISAGFNKRLIKDNMMEFTIEGIRLLFVRPQALIRLMKNFTKTGGGVQDDGSYAELFSIGVSPTCQGKGVGSLLLTQTERSIREGGGKRLSLTTDKFNNESAIAFYQRNGYRILYEFKAYPNREMYRFIKDLE